MIMKPLLFFLSLMSLLVFAISCNKDDNDDGGTIPPDDSDGKDTTQTSTPYLDISISSINFTAEKDASLLKIETNKEWNINSEAKWLSFSAKNGNESTAVIIAACENKKFRRETTVTVKADTITKKIKVTQEGVSKIEFMINGVQFTLLPVLADTTFYLEGGAYFNSRNVYLDSYFISETEITNAQWQAVTGSLPYDTENSFPNLPVVANWEQITQDFITKINELTDYKFRLPTEHEWEVAARGGRKFVQFYNFAGSNIADDVAWYFNNSEGRKHNVGLKQPNELGLYDMSGNVSEWCSDWYREWTEENPPGNNLTNPTGPDSGTDKVVRGGDFIADQFQYQQNSCYIYMRDHLPPDIDTDGFLYGGYYHYPGFRLVIEKD